MNKGSQLLKYALETLKLNYENNPGYKDIYITDKTGPTFFTSVFVSSFQDLVALYAPSYPIIVGIRLSYSSCCKVKFNDTSINMIDQKYTVEKTDDSIMYQVCLSESNMLQSPNDFNHCRQWMPHGVSSKKKEWIFVVINIIIMGTSTLSLAVNI